MVGRLEQAGATGVDGKVDQLDDRGPAAGEGSHDHQHVRKEAAASKPRGAGDGLQVGMHCRRGTAGGGPLAGF